MNEKPQSAPPQAPPPLSRNMISYLGWLMTIVFGLALVVLVGRDLLTEQPNPYSSLVTYLVMPGFLMGGVAMILGGIALEWRRRHKIEPGLYPSLPQINLNLPWQRRRVAIGVALFSVLFTFSALGIYRSYEFTESPEFCGQICHMVMKPEFTAYQHSPHARVACVECHIGPGADWFVKAKISGLRQVWVVLTGTEHFPIPTPVHNLRPAQGTCEQCHWPSKFMDSVEKVFWHFSPDEVNTPIRYNLLLKIGGGSAEMGLGRGIHWHVSPDVTVNYWARDEERQDIPWVEVVSGNGVKRVYRTADCPTTVTERSNTRLMDCIDCHNRPAHIYRSPRQVIDFYMASGALDRSLPFFKRYANALLHEHFSDTPAALTAIKTELEGKYQSWSTGPAGQKLVEKNIATLQDLYQQNFFPEQKVDWRAHPNNIGHFEFPGCFRCHDGKHLDADGKAISADCRLCHEILDQAEGQAAFQPMGYKGGVYSHPRNMGDVWLSRQCTDCHGLKAEPEGIPLRPPAG